MISNKLLIHVTIIKLRSNKIFDRFNHRKNSHNIHKTNTSCRLYKQCYSIIVLIAIVEHRRLIVRGVESALEMTTTII